MLNVSFSTDDNNKLILVTRKSLELLSIVHGVEWSLEFENELVSCSWLNQAQILIGDTMGRVKLFDVTTRCIDGLVNVGGEISAFERLIQSKTVSIDDCYSNANQINDLHDENQIIAPDSKLVKISVRQLIGLSNGFVCVVGLNTIAVYLKHDQGFKLRHLARLPHDRMSTSR